VKSRRAKSPHLPHGGTIAIRDRANQRIGFIVDGNVADALGLAFVPHRHFPEVAVAHTESPWGIGVTIAQRSRESVFGVETDGDRTVEALEEFNVRQVIALSHRVLVAPEGSELADRGELADALTIGIQPHGACKRLMAAAYDLARSNEFVQGVFTRDERSLSDAALNEEGKVARNFGYCGLLIEATTFRTDRTSNASERALGQFLRSIPDAVSPLTSCECQSNRVSRSDERAG
jgi:hypothetical protein